MSVLNVNYEDLTNGKRNIEEQKAKFETAFKNLYTMTDALIANGYQTEDSKSFSTQLRNYEGQFNEVKQILEEYGTELETIKAGFQKVESELSGTAKGINAI